MKSAEGLTQKSVDALRDRILANQYYIFNNPDDQDVKNLKDAYVMFRRCPQTGEFGIMQAALDSIELKREPK